MDFFFSLLVTNGESVILSLCQRQENKHFTLTHQDCLRPEIKRVLYENYKYLKKNYGCDSEYCRFFISDAKPLMAYFQTYDAIDLCYYNNSLKHIQVVEKSILSNEQIYLEMNNNQLRFALNNHFVPYDLNQLTLIGSDYLFCNENTLVIFKFLKPNLPLFKFLTDIDTGKKKESDLKLLIAKNKIKNISFVKLVEPENLVKRLIIKQSTFKLQAKVIFSVVDNQNVNWSDSDENVVVDDKHSEKILRNKALELNCIQELKQVGFFKSGEYWNLLRSNLEEVIIGLEVKDWVVQTDASQLVNKKRFVQGKLEIFTAFKGNWFELSGEFKVENESLPIEFLFEKIKNGSKKIELSNDRVLILSDNLIETGKKLYPFYQSSSKQIQLPVYLSHYLDLENSDSYLNKLDEQSRIFSESLKDFKSIDPVEIPTSLKCTLRDYQKDGLNWLAFISKYQLGGILADDMGLGKTVQIISLLLHKKAKLGKTINLIIAPKSLLFNWEAEVLKFTSDLKVVRYYGNDRLEALKNKDADILLTTYGTVRNDFEILSNIFFDGIFLDESQNIKNHQSKAFQSIRDLKGRLKICITGTPIENHIGELWSQLKFAMPSMVDDHSSFIYQFIKSPTEGGLVEFKKIIFPFVLRRKKEDVAKELPEKVEQTIVCEMTPKQWTFYENIRANIKNDLFSKVDASSVSRSTMHILEALLRLRQASCHTSLLDKNDKVCESGKLQNLVSMVEEVYGDNHKILIFSQFIQMLQIIAKELESKNIPYFYLDGKTNNRGELVSEFQDKKEACVFLISLKAGGVGLNLTSADYVFIFDPWWNPAVEMQAIDRTHRIGQNKTVFAYRMISKGSVEEKIMLLKERKKHIADLVITAEKSLIQELTRDDLEFLFS